MRKIVIAVGFALCTLLSGHAADGQPLRAAATGDRSEGPTADEQFRITRITPEYWRVTIDHPPFNIFGPDSMPQLNTVIAQIERDPLLKVIVFDSAVPGFFLTHYDFTAPIGRETASACGAAGRSCD